MIQISKSSHHDAGLKMLLVAIIIIGLAVSSTGEILHKFFTVADGKCQLTKIAIPKSIDGSADKVFVGGRNVLIRLDSDLNIQQKYSTGPVQDSIACDVSSFANSKTVDNDVSILLLYKDIILVCGSAYHGLCFRHNQNDIVIKNPFVDKSINYLGSQNSSVMLISKTEDNEDIFYVGQSYDGRHPKCFYSEFVTLDLIRHSSHWEFEMHSSASKLSACQTKRKDSALNFLYIFEVDNYIFHIFMRSINESGGFAYETRISRFCKHSSSRNLYDYSSYEEMPISCRNLTKHFDMAISAVFEHGLLYVTFGVRNRLHGLYEIEETMGSALCAYRLTEIQRSYNNEVLTKCYTGTQNYGTPSWQCDSFLKPCSREGVMTITACNQTKMPYGIEAHGDGLIGTARYTSRDVMTAVYPIRSRDAEIAVVGSNTGFIRKITLEKQHGKMYAEFDANPERNDTVEKEMVVDGQQNLFFMTKNMVHKLSMTSCEWHRSCGKCVASGDPLGCGWCYDRCVTKEECSNFTWHNQSCPPEVHKIHPSSGPLEGSTMLTISGENFGKLSSNVNILIGSPNTCDIQSIDNTRITCLTRSSVENTSQPVVVQISNSTMALDGANYFINGRSEQEGHMFAFTVAEIISVFPMKAPISGNVNVTFTGSNFEIGSNHTIMLGKAQCHIMSLESSTITCLVSSCLDCAQINNELTYAGCLYTGNTTLQIDGAVYQTIGHDVFCFTPDPRVIEVSRTKSILSGGLDTEVHGNFFDSVPHHVMQFKVRNTVISTQCSVHRRGSLLVCQTPDVSSVINATDEMAEMSLQFNDITKYTGVIQIHSNPVLDNLDTSSRLKHIQLNEKILELKGTGLNLALRKEDYMVTINGSVCPVLELAMTYLRCNLSSTVHIKDLPISVKVSAGHNWKQYLGYIKFEHLVHDKGRHLVLLAGVGLGIIVVFILIILVVMHKKHIGWFKKRVQDVYRVEYHNNLERTNTETTSGTIPNRYVRQRTEESHEMQVLLPTDQASGGCAVATGADTSEIANMLKQQNIFIERDLIELGQDIGHGNFGWVYKGSYTTNNEKITVAIKTILKAGSQDVNSFLDEAMIMKDFKHPNVLSLIGISVAPGEYPLVILPFMTNGDLLSYIRNERNKPTIKHLVKFGLDVASGMEYLGVIKFIHRDLAARNCMLDEALTAKVADFGLARDIYTKNYYSSDNKKMLPVKWMAPESLQSGTYSTKSDVWSFGVVMWELMTRGAIPYNDVDNWDMFNYLETGRRLKRSEFCPPELYQIMLSCWEFDPDNRPTFTEIHTHITDLVQS